MTILLGRRKPFGAGFVMVLALILVACGTATQTGNPASLGPSLRVDDPLVAALVPRLHGPFGADSTAAATEALADAGIATYSDETAATLVRPVTTPASPLSFVKPQVRNMALEVSARDGYDGGTLDDLATTAQVGLPLSYLIATYASSDLTFGSRLSGQLLAGQHLDDPSNVVFPMLVIALFVSDVAAPSSTSLTAPAIQKAQNGRIVVAAADPCGALNTFFDKTLGDIANDLTKGISNPIVRFIVGAAADLLINKGLNAAKDLLLSVPGLKQLIAGANLLAQLVTVESSLREWAVSTTATPTEIHYTVDGQAASTGHVVADIEDPGGVSFSPAVTSCAQFLRIDLPRSGAPGTPVTWTSTIGIPRHATITHEDAIIPDSRRIELDYTMSSESPDAHARGPEGSGPIAIRVVIHRQDIPALKLLIARLIGGLADPVVDSLAALADPSSFCTIIATFHGEPSPTLSVTPPISPSASICSGNPLVQPGAYTGKVVALFSSATKSKATAPPAHVRTVARGTGGGQASFVVSQDGSLHGTFAFELTIMSTQTDDRRPDQQTIATSTESGVEVIGGTTSKLNITGSLKIVERLTVNGVTGQPIITSGDWNSRAGVPLLAACDGQVSAELLNVITGETSELVTLVARRNGP